MADATKPSVSQFSMPNGDQLGYAEELLGRCRASRTWWCRTRPSDLAGRRPPTTGPCRRWRPGDRVRVADRDDRGDVVAKLHG